MRMSSYYDGHTDLPKIGDAFFILMTNLYSNIFLLVKIQFDQVEMSEVLEIRKNLDLRKILVNPKIFTNIFLKSRVHCNNIF